MLHFTRRSLIIACGAAMTLTATSREAFSDDTITISVPAPDSDHGRYANIAVSGTATLKGFGITIYAYELDGEGNLVSTTPLQEAATVTNSQTGAWAVTLDAPPAGEGIPGGWPVGENKVRIRAEMEGSAEQGMIYARSGFRTA